MRAIVFDLDGTLIDTSALYAEAYRRAFVAELGEPPSLDEMFARRPSSERIFLLEWFGDELGDRIHRRVVDHYRELAPELFGGFFAGVPEMLAQVRARGMRTAIVTGKSRAAFDATCVHVDLIAGFEAIVVEDDAPRPKPDPQCLLQALERLGVAPSESLYVGDTPIDAEAAARAGMRAAAALWSRPPSDRARVAGKIGERAIPLHDPAELLALAARTGVGI